MEEINREWSIPNIIQIIGIAFVFLINIHQSLRFNHFESECCLNGKGCCSVVIDGFQSETGKESKHSGSEIPI